jgi:hypothetical protein
VSKMPSGKPLRASNLACETQYATAHPFTNKKRKRIHRAKLQFDRLKFSLALAKCTK